MQGCDIESLMLEKLDYITLRLLSIERSLAAIAADVRAIAASRRRSRKLLKRR